MGLFTGFVEDLFFHADSLQYWKPEHYGLRYVPFKAQTALGNTIDGIVLLPKKQENVPSRTVVYFNPAYFNREYCLPQVAFLAQAGFSVALFDYSGCGISTGKVSLGGLLTDAEAVFDWLDHSEFQKEQYVLFGQGLGGDAAMQYFHAHQNRVSGIVLESVYDSRRGWVKERWGPVIGDIAAKSIECAAINPGEALSQAKVPVVLIYPSEDTHVRKSERQRLIEHAPRKSAVWEAKGLRFLGVFGAQRNAWHDDLIKFIAKLAGKD